MNSKSKILVCGDVDGKFKTLFTRVNTINEKSGPFDFLLCVGTFFGNSSASWEPYKNGTLTVPVPTYVLGPNCAEHTGTEFYPDINGCELCPNVSYLGKRGLFSVCSGLKLTYVSGVEDETSQDHTFTPSDITTVRDVCLRGQPSFRGVDILATSSWPQDIMNLDEKALTLHKPKGSHLLSWLAVQIKPRYHFCAVEGIYYERSPYMNHNTKGDSAEHSTRFIGLAKVGNAAKQKWLYALTIEPIDRMKASELYQHTTDMTPCPYRGAMLNHTLTSVQEKPSQFFYDMNASSDGHRKRTNRNDDGPERKQRPVFDQGTCWFCLASPEVEKHLVISIGTEVYLAMAKGPLVPDHVLILPVGHHQSLSEIPEEVQKEIKKFKSSLKKFYKQQQKVPVYFERNYKTSHLQIQVVPIASGIAGSELKEIFQEQATAAGIQLDELPAHAKLEQVAQPGSPYFYVELPTGEKMFARAKKNFPLQFGRDVLASKDVLDIEDRADWRDCKLTKEEETEQAKQFRTAFQPFDFTL